MDFLFWLWLNNLLHCNLTAEFSVAAPVVPLDKRFLLSPHDFVPCPDPMRISWSWLQLHFLKVPAGEGADAPAWTKTGHHSWRAAGPSPALGEEALAKSNIPKRSAGARDFFSCQKYHTCLCRSELGWRKTLGSVWSQMGGLKHIHWRTTTKKNKTHARSKPHTVHFQFKVHEFRETAYI